LAMSSVPVTNPSELRLAIVKVTRRCVVLPVLDELPLLLLLPLPLLLLVLVLLWL
jgi:hypothetical protein